MAPPCSLALEQRPTQKDLKDQGLESSILSALFHMTDIP